MILGFSAAWNFLAKLDVVCSEFVDELPELDETYSIDPCWGKGIYSNATKDIVPRVLSPVASIVACSIDSDDRSPPGSSLAWNPRIDNTSVPEFPASKRRKTNDTEISSSFHSTRSLTPILNPSDRTPGFESSPGRRETSGNSLLRATYTEQTLSPEVNHTSSSPQLQIQALGSTAPSTPGVWPHVDLQEACLIRYFIDELACWVRCVSQAADES